jgi:rhodanese-related sulfurtransferase
MKFSMKKKDNNVYLMIFAIIIVLLFVIIGLVMIFNNRPINEQNKPEDTITPPEDNKPVVNNTVINNTPINPPTENIPSFGVVTSYGYKEVTLAEAKDIYDNYPNTMIIDFTAAEVYKLGHIKGALNYPINDGTLEKSLLSLDKNKVYLVYARQNGDSLTGTKLMFENGFLNIFRLKGNYGPWVNDGYPIEKSI